MYKFLFATVLSTLISTAFATEPSLVERQSAAEITASGSPRNACTNIRSMYWEIGNKDSVLVSGSKAGITDSTVFQIASASKWLYGAYVLERKLTLDQYDTQSLNFTSGYTTFSSACPKTGTVAGCVKGSNGDFTAENKDKFYYSGAHMQNHAAKSSLANMKNAALAYEISTTLGLDYSFNYSQPQLAGGGVLPTITYRSFLQRVLSNQLQMRYYLGSNQVCTLPRVCPTALNSPVPENWNYSIGHWVETVGDGAYSSPGAFGFYPWISADKQWYGVIARDSFGGSWSSVQCGRLIRKAWITGTPQK